MVMNLDLELFCENLRATKPPYECPMDGCGKIYKSYAGIQFHLYHFDHDNPDSGLSPNSLPPSSPGRHTGALQHRQSGPNISSVRHDALDGDNALWVEVDLSGCTYKINIHEPLVLINDETAEKSEKDLTEKSNLLPKDITGLHKAESSGALSPSIKLPEAHFKVLDDYVQPSQVAPKPSNYYRFIEKTQEEIDDEVEYDLDEEDFVWLELINERRKKENLPSISKDVLELLMDRFEKHCYFEVKTSRRLPRDEDAICSVCLDGECHINNVILFCDLCNLAVHQECYGVPHIPEGSWICRRCLLSPSKPVECCLCPNKRGAFKQTEDGRWAHVICALWIPEVGFANGVFLEPIDGIERIAAARWKLACYICKQRGTGACIQCHKTSCYTAFHVTCAQQAGLYMKTEPMRDTGINGTTLSVRKTAFCDIHSPQTESTLMTVSSSEEDKESSCSSLLPAEARAKSRLRLRKARKALAESRNSSPVLAVPVISPNSIKEITDKVNFRAKEEFIRRLCSYWSLKRQSKNGVPLLRTSMSSIHILRNRGAHQPLHSPVSTGSSGNKSKVNNTETSDMTLEEQFKYCKKLRQQLEKVRLLNELVRKREKLKQEHLRLHEKVLQLQLFPFNTLLSHTLEQLQEKNFANSFTKSSHASSLEGDAGSSAVLDLTKMQRKLNHHGYTAVDEMASDFSALISTYMNPLESTCMNQLESSNNQQLKAYTRLKDQGDAIFLTANQVALKIGFDPKTGLHLPRNLEPASNPLNDVEPTIKEKLQTSAVETKETTEILSLVASQESAKSEMLPNQEKATPRPIAISRPIGINRRSAVLHSKKARQSAMRLFGSVPDEVKDNLMSSERKPDPSDSEKDCQNKSQLSTLSDETLIQDEAKNLKIVGTSSKSTGESEKAIASEALKNSCSGEAHASKNKAEPPPCIVHDCGSDLSENVNSETKDKLRGRKRLRSVSETCSASEKHNLNVDESQNEEASEHHRQYATRGKKVHTQQPSENEEIVIPLEPLSLVWAKCTGFPWYPALVIDPKMSKSAAFHNTVPLPIPSSEVLSLRKKYSQPVFLVSFFDARRTWQWLPREKLDPLGVDSGLDNAKLAENKKPSMRQAVRTAYQKAVRHRCMVTGEPFPQTCALDSID